MKDKNKKKQKKEKSSKMSIRESILSASREVLSWPQWKQDLSGFESDYKVHVCPKK